MQIQNDFVSNMIIKRIIFFSIGLFSGISYLHLKKTFIVSFSLILMIISYYTFIGNLLGNDIQYFKLNRTSMYDDSCSNEEYVVSNSLIVVNWNKLAGDIFKNPLFFGFLGSPVFIIVIFSFLFIKTGMVSIFSMAITFAMSSSLFLLLNMFPLESVQSVNLLKDAVEVPVKTNNGLKINVKKNLKIKKTPVKESGLYINNEYKHWPEDSKFVLVTNNYFTINSGALYSIKSVINNDSKWRDSVFETSNNALQMVGHVFVLFQGIKFVTNDNFDVMKLFNRFRVFFIF